MPWPWTSRPKSPFEFLHSDGTSSGSATPNGRGGSTGSNIGASSPPTKNVSLNRPAATTTTSRATATAATSSTTSKAAAQRLSAAASGGHKSNHETTAQNSRSASALGFSTDPQAKNKHGRSSSSTSGASYSGAGTTQRTAASAVIPEEPAHIHTQLRTTKHHRGAASLSSGTSKLNPTRKNSIKDSDRKASKSPEPSSRHLKGIDSISSASSSLQSDLNNHGNGKQRSFSAGSQANDIHGRLSSSLIGGRALSPAPLSLSTAIHGSLPRSQKATMPSSSRQSPTSDEVFYYELPESSEQVNGLNASEIEERDLKHKAVIDLNTILATQPRTISENQTRESMLEAELCDQYESKSTDMSSSSVASSEPIPIPEVTTVPIGSSEAHRVVQVMKLANEHLQKKVEAKEALLTDRLAELEQIETRHAISIQQQKHNFQLQIKQLVEQHRRELHGATQRNTKRVEAVKREMAQSVAAAENQQRHLEQITALQAQVEQLRNLDKTRQDNQDALIKEATSQAAEELAAARKEFASKEETWEIQTEEMRRQLLQDTSTAECNCGSKSESEAIEQLKRDHENDIAALKNSIRILEGSRGTTVEQLEEDQRVYRKVSELEASLASKVRALAAERKTSERLRASLAAAEEAKSSEQDQSLELQQLRASFEKEKELLVAEYQAVIDADRSASEAERNLSQRLLAEARAEHQNFQEQTTFVHEDKFKVAQEQFEATIRHSNQEKQALQTALDDTRSQFIIQKSAFELRLRNQVQEAEHQYRQRHSSEKQAQDVKLEEAKAELEKVRRELGEEVQKLQAEVAQTKDRDSQILSELQQQISDEEENKQQLLDRVAKAEAERAAVEAEFATAKSRFDGADSALAEQSELLRKAEKQIESLNESVRAMRDEVENEKRNALQMVTELRTQMQTRERKSSEFHVVKQNEIESLHFQIRTAENKLQASEIQMESLRQTLRERENALAAMREEKYTESVWLDEKRDLIDKHNQLNDSQLSTITKLEDTINQIRRQLADEAKAAAAKAAEQQNLVVQWMSASNRKADEAKSLSRQLTLARDEYATLKSQMESMHRHARQMSDLETRIQSLSKELQESARTVARRDATIRQLEDALQQAKSSSGGRTSPAQAELQRDLEKSRTEVGSLKEKLDLYETEYRHLFDDYERLKIEQEDMKFKSTERLALGV
ncbi:hypothetical protein ABW21_db0208696 [Orbilia brochopaga]|nr:hypothetical protein ABW21_db0208696 [Drechslerella brochopaga]